MKPDVFCKKLIFCTVMILLISYYSPSHAAWKWTYLIKKTDIECYVFIDKRFQGSIKSYAEVQKKNLNDFFETVQNDYKNFKPLNDAEITFVGSKNKGHTDEAGYSQMNAWWLTARNKELQITAPGVELTFNLDLNSLANVFFIRIPNDSSPQVLSLKEAPEGAKPSNAVILVHGFGVDIGPFTPSRHRNSWEKACELFKSDPDLADYDFYMPDHWDDQNLVESSRELGCFLRLVRRAHGLKAKIIILAHSAGGLIVRHYTVSEFYMPGTVDRFLMLATPNRGSMASLIHLEPSWVPGNEMDGNGEASDEILSNSDFLDCLNNRSKMPIACKNQFFMDQSLQGHTGLNPDIPTAIVAGEIKSKIVEGVEQTSEQIKSWVKSWFGAKSAEYANKALNELREMLDKLPPGDVLVSLENQLIKGVPFVLLPYPHGFIHRPEDKKDNRYIIMKRFVLTGDIGGISHL